MTRLIGTRCTASDCFSQGVLIARFPIRNCGCHGPDASQVKHKTTYISAQYTKDRILRVGDLTLGPHLFPFRTEKLSLVVAMILIMWGK